ncbi:MAG: F-type H+-transporting ATPase subunit epsilon [Bradymonadia bacterium]|jgi:F-type H+-transporting ATPase subunit epsilon
MADLQLEIVTPTTTVYAGAITEVTLPGALGEMGVLPGHLPLITSLKAGELVAFTPSGVRYFAVEPGFAQVLPGRVRVLVDECFGAGDIDEAEAKAALADYEKRVDKDEFRSDAELTEATAVAASHRARLSIKERATKG